MRATPRARRADRLAWTTTRRGRLTSAALAVSVGFSGAAAVGAFLLSPRAVAEVTDFGSDGDGLARYVVAPDGVRVTDAHLEAPALVAGTYDVYVFAPDRTTVSRLAGALTFVDVDAGEEPGADIPAPGDSPGTGLPPAPDEGREPDRTPEQVAIGPGGQRLVSSPLFRSVPRSIWDLDCSTACSGVPL